MSTATNLETIPAAGCGSLRGRRSPEDLRRLVRRACDGDQRAWDALVAEFGGLVWGVARANGVNHADAADVSQITWMTLVKHLGDLRDPARLGAWLATTARRQCLRVHAARGELPMGDDLPEPVDDLPEPDADLLVGERDAALLRMLVADPAPSYEEISAALGMPVGSIGPTRARALERLRREALREGLRAVDA